MALVMICGGMNSYESNAASQAAGKLTGQAISARKHVKNAKTFLKMNKKYSAACSYLDAMDIKPQPKTMKQLDSILEDAYKEKKLRSGTKPNCPSLLHPPGSTISLLLTVTIFVERARGPCFKGSNNGIESL